MNFRVRISRSSAMNSTQQCFRLLCWEIVLNILPHGIRARALTENKLFINTGPYCTSPLDYRCNNMLPQRRTAAMDMVYSRHTGWLYWVSIQTTALDFKATPDLDLHRCLALFREGESRATNERAVGGTTEITTHKIFSRQLPHSLQDNSPPGST